MQHYKMSNHSNATRRNRV